MAKTNKKGFTIVELVIVIAVIAILAAVLIPTFSSLVTKANLSADTMAVREMTQALKNDEALHGKPASMEQVMQILANAGYNSDNWVCLTAGYEVYWFQEENVLILYNSTTKQVEYPTEYDAAFMTQHPEYHFMVYNQNQMTAQKFQTTLGDATSASNGQTNLVSVNKQPEVAENIQSTIDVSLVNYNKLLSAANKENIEGNVSLRQAILKNAYATSADIYTYASETKVSETSGNAAAILQLSSVGATSDASKGAIINQQTQEIVPNLCCITMSVSDSATPAEKEAAEKAAGEYVYTLFSQITSGKLQDDISIVIDLPENCELKLDSTREWVPCKTFSGYFGTADANNPIVISGAKMSSATSTSQTVQFIGSKSRYFVTGFFGTVFGNTTIENVVFKDITIDSPAEDFEKMVVGEEELRNTVGIIGGITDGRNAMQTQAKVANVTLRNIKVENSVTIIGRGCAAGLVGYVGSAVSNGNLTGKITIEGCTVSAKVQSDDNKSSQDYKAVGGIVGFYCRAEGIETTIKKTEFNGSLKSYGVIGAAIGDFRSRNNSTFAFIECKFDRCSMETLNSDSVYGIGAIFGNGNSGNEESMKITKFENVSYYTELPIYVPTTKKPKQFKRTDGAITFEDGFAELEAFTYTDGIVIKSISPAN